MHQGSLGPGSLGQRDIGGNALREGEVRSWLEALQAGTLGLDEVVARLSAPAELDLGIARLDLGRTGRTGVPEAVLAEGKSDEELLTILEALGTRGSPFVVTRVDAARGRWLSETRPGLSYEPRGRLLRFRELPPPHPLKKPPWIVSGGTSDHGVVEEAYWALRTSGVEAQKMLDVGVAGLHRLLTRLPVLREASLLIVVAGMEGALPSVLAGLVACPVIAVPTSVGYGASLGGVAALLGMLSSCAPGITVTNIDNGFGAAVAAFKMLQMAGLGPGTDK
jgi:pyridinium-3,5-biscarboxylic acid mononucleotide synthase